MQRLLGQCTGTCFQRCVGMDAINALSSTTYEMSRDLGGDYFDRFSAFSMDFQSERFKEEKKGSYTVLRAEFDEWFAEKAEAAGADVVTGIKVDKMLVRDGKVAGVQAGEDRMPAKVVILADGVHSLLAEQIGLKAPLSSKQVAVGIKEVIALSETTINDRFNTGTGEGQARLFVGDCTAGLKGGGFLYTNRDTISLGLVVKADQFMDMDIKLPDLMNRFKTHPAVAPLIEGGRTVEYTAHLVPEAGLSMLPRLFSDGILVVGDAAGLVLNLGYIVRGMDLAIASGRMAADTVIRSKERGDFSAAALSAYADALKDSFVMQDLSTFKSAPAFVDNPRLYRDYPELATGIATDLFTVDGHAAGRAMKKIWPNLKGVGLWNLVKDAWKGRVL